MDELSKNLLLSKLQVIIITLLILIFFFINISSIYLVGPYAWDDGAITLAYARTLAENGRFSLTAVSEIVEGSSSLLYTLFMAGLHFFFHFEFTGIIIASQITAFLFFFATLILMFFNVKNAISNQFYAYLTIGLFASLPMFTAEIQNGMEMTLLGFLFALYYLKFYKSIVWIFILTPLLLLARFESIFYLGVALTLLFILGETKKRTFIIGIYTIIIFTLISLFRFIYFDDILPNTIWAKMNPPYSSDVFLSNLLRKFSGLIEFFKVTFFLILSLVIIFFLSSIKKFNNDIGFYLVFSFIVFSFVAGKNLGYDGRMFLSCLPILIILIFRGLVNIKINEFQIIIFQKNINFNYNVKMIIMYIIVISLAMTHILNYSLHRKNFTTALSGGYYQGLLLSPFKLLIDNSEYKILDYDITPQNYKITGNAINKIRYVLNLNEIAFVAPDVGGLGLCCNQIKVIDSALLTNKELAKNGYKIFDEYISKTKPDIIETHGIWSESSKIYNSEFFQKNYIPIIFENNFLWLRTDLYNQLILSPLLIKNKIDKEFNIKEVRYAKYSIDLDYIKSLELNYIDSFNYIFSD
jgi:hypothetical protein